MIQPREDIEAVRGRILDAAGERFRQFGFGKTTMSEIAGDCGMSAANLYRYFDNKEDIGAAMACQCLSQKAETLMQVVRDESLTAAEKIEAYILANLRYTHGQWAEQPRLNELVDYICHKRTDLVDDYLSKHRAMLKTMLQEGIDAGELESCDVDEVAEAVKAAMFMFDYPNAMNACRIPLADFEDKARGVAKLVLNGLRTR